MEYFHSYTLNCTRKIIMRIMKTNGKVDLREITTATIFVFIYSLEKFSHVIGLPYTLAESAETTSTT